MRLSVVIPAVNEAPWIERAISSALAAGCDEVIVADSGSTDDTCQLALQCGAHVVHGPRGRAVQQNCGARQATGDVLMFLHADNWLDPSAGQQVRECLRDPAMLGGAFEQRIEAAGVLYRLLEKGNAARVRWTGMAYGDQAIFLRRQVFEQLGDFPEVDLMEDVLLMRALCALAKPELLPGPVHVHPRRWQSHGVVRQTLRNWTLRCGERLGVSPARLANFYPSHDRDSSQ